MKKIMKRLKNKWMEIGSILMVLVFAGILTIFQPWDGDTVGYFSDVTTPLILVVGILIIIVGVCKSR